MDETLGQLRELLFGAIPTVIVLVLLNVFYRLLLHNPLQKTLSERRERTEGAVKRAQADIAAAEAKTNEYEQRLRAARLEVFKAQEARRRQVTQARAKTLAEARENADRQVKLARTQIEREVAEAKAALHAQGESLANEVIARILKPQTVTVGGK